MELADWARFFLGENVCASVMAANLTPMDKSGSRHKHNAPAPALMEALRSRCQRASTVIQLVSSAPTTRQASTRSSNSHCAAREAPSKNDEGSPTSEVTIVTLPRSVAIWLAGAA